MKYSKDGQVVFNSDTHTYYKGEKRLLGVTSFISRYHEKFDAPVEAVKYAKKHGLDPVALLAEWEAKGLQSRTEGTATHLVLERYCETRSFDNLLTDVITPKQLVAAKFINDYFRTKKLTPVAWEYIVYGENLATQIDLIAKSEKGFYYAFDYKTSKEVSKNGYGKRMFKPYHELPDANYFHYSIQVSIGKQLCRDYDIKDLFIIHIGLENYEIIKADYIHTPEELL